MRYLFLVYLFFTLTDCKNHSQEGMKVNMPIYTSIKSDVLFKDSKNNIYLRVSNTFIGTDSIYYEYLNQVGYDLVKQDSLMELKNIVDTITFNYVNSSKSIYKDVNYLYVHQQYPATYPPLKIIDINPNKAVVFRKNYIKDDKNVYFLSVKVSENAPDFKYITNKDSLLLFGDDRKIILNWGEISKEDFAELSLPKKIKDSLYSKYFP